MDRWPIIAMLAVGASVTVNACASPDVSPLPVLFPTQISSAPSASPTPSPTISPTPARSGSPKPTLTAVSTCYGAIRFDLDLQKTELALLKSMCFTAGAILRIFSIGPGQITVQPPELVSVQYEAAVHDIRFVRPGTVTITIAQGGQDQTITVVVR